MNWLYYLAEANLYLGVFYLGYCLFLNRNTHYQLSRAYLVFSCIAAFILPLLQLGVLKQPKSAETVSAASIITPVIPPPVNVTYTYQAPIAHAGAAPANTVPAAVEHHFTLQDYLLYAYLLGAAVLFVLLLVKLYTLFRITRSGQAVNEGKYRVIYLNGTDVAFSFFNYLFIGKDAPGAHTIIRHELVHIRQKHSADVILLEILKVINWFNPLVYLLQNSLKTVHEYIADEQTAAYETDALTYSSFLLNNAYGAGGSSITHSFFNYNLLKKRIIMLNQQRSGNLARLKYLLIIPICAALLCSSTLVFSKTYGWVDLSPASIKSPGKYAMLNANLMAKRKRLKVTQNGVSTITDQFAVDLKNKKVVYTANTLTKADKSALLKNNHIKVEVVTDSTHLTNKEGRLILPVVNVDGYWLMDHFLHHNIHYTTTKGEKGGLVEVGFSLDNDRHIINAKVVKSGGPKLDALALDGFNAYKGVVTDEPGKNYKIGVYFFTDDYSIFKTDSLGKDPEFAGELIITNYKYPISRTSKGYEYDESDLGFPGDDNNMSQAKVVIYDKNDEATWFYQKRCTPADLKMLKDKYGYTFPSSYSMIIKSIYPDNFKKSHLGYIFDIASYLDAPYAGKLYNYVLNNIEYPQEAKKSLTGGVVVLDFNLDNAGAIGDIRVAQSAGNGFDEAAVKALQGYKDAIKDNAGEHSIAILFCVAENEYRPVVSEKIKKDGYVGELAVCDEKSPFVSGSAKYTPPPTAPGSPAGGH